jgi:hypothetical protein
VGGTRPGRTRVKPKDLSTCDREERGRGEGGGVYVVCMCERGAWDLGGCELVRAISTVRYTQIHCPEFVFFIMNKIDPPTDGKGLTISGSLRVRY